MRIPRIRGLGQEAEYKSWTSTDNLISILNTLSFGYMPQSFQDTLRKISPYTKDAYDWARNAINKYKGESDWVSQTFVDKMLSTIDDLDSDHKKTTTPTANGVPTYRPPITDRPAADFTMPLLIGGGVLIAIMVMQRR